MVESIYKLSNHESILSNETNIEYFMGTSTLSEHEDSIEEVIEQIEFSWKMSDLDDLFTYLQHFLCLIQDSKIQLPSNFFESYAISIILTMLSDNENSESIKSSEIPIHIQNILLNIIEILLQKYCQYVTPPFANDLIEHILPIIDSGTESQIKKCLSFILLLCQNFPEMYLLQIINPLFIIHLFSKSHLTTEPGIIYDGDVLDKISYFLKEILCLLPPTTENIQLVFDHSNLDPKIFVVFQKLIKKTPELIEMFAPDIYLSYLYDIFHNHFDYSILSSCVDFCYTVNNYSQTEIDIQHIFFLLSVINDNMMNSPIIEKLTRLEAMCLNFVSHFAKVDVHHSIMCIENGILDLIKNTISSEFCQHQLKREAARCLFEIILNVNTQNYQLNDPSIVMLLLNVLDYNDPVLNSSILSALDKLIEEERIADLNDVYHMCGENVLIFENLCHDENEETSLKAQQFAAKYQFC